MTAPRILDTLNRYDLKTHALLHAVSEQRQQALSRVVNGLAAQVCNAYLNGDVQARIVIVRTIGRKAALLGHLFTYAQRCIDDAETAYTARKMRRAKAQLRLGIAADTILDGRIDERYLRPIQDRMIALAQALGLDLQSIAVAFDVPVAELLQFVYVALRRNQFEDAYDMLTRLLYRHPELENDGGFVNAAELATGKIGYAALATLRDRDLRWRALTNKRETVERRGITRLSDKLQSMRQRQEMPASRVRMATA